MAGSPRAIGSGDVVMARASGAPAGSRYVDQRSYTVPESLTWLPTRVRLLWQTRFPELVAPPQALAG
jgi:hypothetical protein